MSNSTDCRASASVVTRARIEARDGVGPWPRSETRSAAGLASAAVPRWVLVTSGLAPVLLIGGWLLADALQPSRYDPVRQTVSVLAGHAGRDRWVMTAAMLAVGLCHLATAYGLRVLRRSARVSLAIAGVAGLGVALSPEPLHGSTPRHLAFTALGAVIIATWPLLTAARRADPTHCGERRRRGSCERRVARAVLVDGGRDPARGLPRSGRTPRLGSPNLLAIRRRSRCVPLPATAPTPPRTAHRRTCEPPGLARMTSCRVLATAAPAGFIRSRWRRRSAGTDVRSCARLSCGGVHLPAHRVDHRRRRICRSATLSRRREFAFRCRSIARAPRIRGGRSAP